jgi:uncharacterized membrane protein YvbJ
VQGSEKFCPECGVAVASEASHCQECGEELAFDDLEGGDGTAGRRTPQRSAQSGGGIEVNRARIAVVVGLIILIGAVVVAEMVLGIV